MSIEIASASASINPDRDNQSTYTKLEPTPAEQAILNAHPCPVCLDAAELWELVEVTKRRTTIFKHVCCANGDAFGPQVAEGSIMREGCVLNFPPTEFYQPTRHEAINYWSEYSVALRILRWSNEIKRLSAASPDDTPEGSAP